MEDLTNLGDQITDIVTNEPVESNVELKYYIR